MAMQLVYSEVVNNPDYMQRLRLKVKGEKRYIKAEGYESVFFGTVPQGKYHYYARHSEKNWTRIVSVKSVRNTTLNFWGTIVTDEPLQFDGNYEIEISRTYIDDGGEDTKELMAAPIWGSNVQMDWLDGFLYSLPTQRGNRFNACGFINEKSFLAEWRETENNNSVYYYIINGTREDYEALAAAIKEYLKDGSEDGNITERYTIEENRLIQSFYFKETE